MSHLIVYTILNAVVVATTLGGLIAHLEPRVAEHIAKWLVEALYIRVPRDCEGSPSSIFNYQTSDRVWA